MHNRNSNNHELIDVLGRRISYLRVSVTEDCNFRCKYCYSPVNAGKSNRYTLSDDELLTLIKSFVRLGVNKVRLTGGEPLMRPTIVDLVRRTAQIEDVYLIGLTTNGYLLSSFLYDLIDAGLNRLNISLNSLDPETFRNITGCDGLDTILEAIEIAEKSGAFPHIKINIVLMRGINDNEVENFINWALERKIDLRFIEFMNTQNSGWDDKKYISEREIRERINMDLAPYNNPSDIHGPARCYRIKGYPARISFISSVSHNFCKACNRLRLLSSGHLIGCLFRDDRVNLLPLLRNGCTTEEIDSFILKTVSTESFRRLPDSSGDHYKPLMNVIGG